MTNVTNFHTCSIGRMYLISPIILIMDCHLLKFTSNMIRRSTVYIPVCVITMTSSSRPCRLLILFIFIIIISIPATICFMSYLLADLTNRLVIASTLLGCVLVLLEPELLPRYDPPRPPLPQPRPRLLLLPRPRPP